MIKAKIASVKDPKHVFLGVLGNIKGPGASQVGVKEKRKFGNGIERCWQNLGYLGTATHE